MKLLHIHRGTGWALMAALRRIGRLGSCAHQRSIAQLALLHPKLRGLPVIRVSARPFGTQTASGGLNDDQEDVPPRPSQTLVDGGAAQLSPSLLKLLVGAYP
eukprot:scaffold7433_cov457-Prasinococcus_capsulatus_cf.AAC.2